MYMDEIARSKSTHGVREAFVIFRVYDIESQAPGLDVYYDPWTIDSGMALDLSGSGMED